MIDETTNEAERVGFCQDCGRPLTRQTVRTVGSGVFCEPCLERRLAAAGAAAGVGSAVPPPPAPVGTMPPMGGATPNPTLAALLGLIPGVGAMYNGQFAKGIAHIVIFALIQSLTRASDVFGVLLAGWIFYQAFDAYHTAKARRDGLPLPDPFGLNNIGEQIAGANFRSRPGSPGQPTGYPGWTGYTPPPQQPIVTPPPGEAPAAPRGAAWSQPVTPAAGYTAPAAAWSGPAAAPQAASTPWAAPADVTTDAGVPVVPVRHFPTGAVWLIGLGLVFLLATLEPGWHLRFARILPFLLMALAVWLFTRRMMAGGTYRFFGVNGEQTGYKPRVLCWLRWPLMLFTVGLLLALQAFDVVRLGRTWPVLFIVLGATLLLERSLAAPPVVAEYDAPYGPPGAGGGQNGEVR